MDYSNYPPNHTLFDLNNKAKLGFFKDELCGNHVCTEFVISLKSKCYAMKLKPVDNLKGCEEKKVCKGLGRVAIKNRLKFKHYKDCLFKATPRRFDYQIISSKKNSVSTIRQNKRALSDFDSKRWIYSCGVHSDPYGSKILKDKFLFCQKCKY